MENQNNLLKKVFTKEEKEHYISRWQAGGKSKMKFAAENGLKYYTFVNCCHTLLPCSEEKISCSPAHTKEHNVQQ